MFNLSGQQKKAQIMIINNHDLKLFIWQDNVLSYHSSYRDTPDEKRAFFQTLIKSPGFPVIVLTDFIEESFLNESMVHVTGSDRKALLERKLGYAFRTSPYRIAKVTSREKEGRRDDKVLLSALTKPKLLKPWISPLLEHQIPVQSISSVAYLTEAYIQTASIEKAEFLLIISLERNSGLRQTYLKNGKTLFSRLTSSLPEDTDAITDNIYQESLQIRSYLERIKILPYDAPLKILIFSPFNTNELKIDKISSTLNSFESIDTNEESAAYSLELNNFEPNATFLFLAHTLRKRKLANTYASFDIRKYFYLNTISKTLSWSAAAFLITFILFKTPDIFNTFNNKKQQELIISQTSPIVKEYQTRSLALPEAPIPSSEMALIVETYEKIKQQSFLPGQAMSIISQALSNSPELKITTISWNLLETKSEQSKQGFGSSNLSVNQDNAFQLAVTENRSLLKVEVNGLSFSPSSYREAQNQVITFANTLESFPGISVEPLKMPTDVRLDTPLTTTVNGDELQAQFSLELTFAASQ